MNKKVKWLRDTTYFYNRAECLVDKNTSLEYRLALDYVIETFLKSYNCEICSETTQTNALVLTCSEEDLLIIQLAEPGAIFHVLSK